MKELSIEEKISLAYNYTKFKTPNLILGDIDGYKLIKIDVTKFNIKYIVDYYPNENIEERIAFIKDNILVFTKWLFDTPDEAIRNTFHEIENLSFSEIQLILDIAGK